MPLKGHDSRYWAALISGALGWCSFGLPASDEWTITHDYGPLYVHAQSPIQAQAFTP